MGERTAFALAAAQIVLICNGSLRNYAQASAMHNGGSLLGSAGVPTTLCDQRWAVV